MTPKELDERCIAIETKVAYQEKVISDLNEVLLERGRTIDLLEKRVEKLERSLRGESPERISDDEKPPHY